MDVMELIPLVSRWLHIGTVIVLLGGTVFLRFILMPAAEPLPAAEHDALRARLMARWRKVVMGGIALFLLTGFYNYLVVAAPRHRGDRAYHALMGTKIVLAFVVFFLASALTGRSAVFESIRRQRAQWLVVLCALAFTVVAISGVLRVRF